MSKEKKKKGEIKCHPSMIGIIFEEEESFEGGGKGRRRSTSKKKPRIIKISLFKFDLLHT